MNHDSENSFDYDVLAKYFNNAASENEVAEIDAWRNAALQNETEFHQLYLVWMDTGLLNESSNLRNSVNVDAAWSNLNNRINDAEKVIPITRKRTNWLKYAGVAAVIFILIGGYLTTLINSDQANMMRLQAATQVETIELVDGTNVTLNKQSFLEYPEAYSDDIRMVRLEGEGFFNVARDTNKPFVIEAGNALIEVLGTSFNVEAFKDRDSVLVFVHTGKVQLSKDDNAVILTPGMLGVYDKISGKMSIVHDSGENASAWKDHKLVFKRTKLSRVIKTLNELYDIKIEIGSDAIADCKVTVRFDDEPIENIIDIIVSTFGLELTKINDKIILDGDGC